MHLHYFGIDRGTLLTDAEQAALDGYASPQGLLI